MKHLKTFNEGYNNLIGRQVIITKEGLTKGQAAYIIEDDGFQRSSNPQDEGKIKVRFGLDKKNSPVGWYKRHEFVFAGDDSKDSVAEMQTKYNEKKKHFEKVREEFNQFKFELKKKGYNIIKDKITAG